MYLGPKGTSTAIHADVLRSYSWSTNVCGRKVTLLRQHCTISPGSGVTVKGVTPRKPGLVSGVPSVAGVLEELACLARTLTSTLGKMAAFG